MLRISVLLALIGLGTFINPPVNNQYALLIAIGQYPSSSGAEPLHAQNDLMLFSQTLRKQGFLANHLCILTEQKATRKSIAQSFDSLAHTLPTGSCLVVYFTGHGLQLPDDNHDEPDNLDEAILPYDGRVDQPKTLIRDDELGRWVNQIRRRIGSAGHLLFLFDSCHSGSILRHDQANNRSSRGIPSNRSSKSVSPKPGTSGWYENTGKAANLQLASYVLVAATTDGQPSFECADASGQAFGPLTLAACRGWTAQPGTTYRTFFGAIQKQMSRLAPYQLPTLEGNVDGSFLNRAKL
jgi:hypothetical protein